MQFGLLFDPPRPALAPESLCDEEERAVLAALRWGRAAARQVADIAADAGLTDRRAQTVLQHLLLHHQIPVGTSMGEPAGNYLIDSPEDLEATEKLLRRRALSMLHRGASLKRMTFRRYLELVQGDLLEER